MERGKPLRWHYFESTTARKGQITRWCYSKHKNVAGYYLSWIEIWKGKNGERFNFHGWDTKADAIDDCRRRYDDSKHQSGERKYTVPTLSKQVMK
jgi:hypothetical protein